MSAIQPYQVTTNVSDKTLSQKACPFWIGLPRRSFSRLGSYLASQTTLAALKSTISPMKIQPPRQSSVPAGTKRAAPTAQIQATDLMTVIHIIRSPLGGPYQSDTRLRACRSKVPLRRISQAHEMLRPFCFQ